MNTDKTTNKYRATFEVPAMVRIEIDVDADNQQEGLITAHDLIAQASVSQAKVVSMSLDRATNTAFERLEIAASPQQNEPEAPTVASHPGSAGDDAVAPAMQAPIEAAVPPNPAEFTGQHRVELFLTKDQSGEPVKTMSTMPFPDARRVAEGVLAEKSIYGSARVFDEFGTVVLRTMAPRGGFEVHAFQEEVPADAVPDTSSDRLFTWLPSLKDAKKTALELLARSDIKLVRIVDYSDRQAGPRLVREIR